MRNKEHFFERGENIVKIKEKMDSFPYESSRIAVLGHDATRKSIYNNYLFSMRENRRTSNSQTM